jgi:ABC-type nitrate/sulfonate/bicarbonate transport system substrate-binding protein
MKRRRVMIATVAALAALVILGAACSKDSGKARMQRTAIRLACVMNPDLAPVHIAIAQGFFAAEGLDVAVKPFTVGKTALAAVIQGESDLATALETPVMLAILGGAKICIVAAIATSDRNLAIVANRGAGIAVAADLVGRTIGVTKGTAADYFLNSFLVAQGIEAGEVRIVDAQPGEIVEALRTGRIAAAVLWAPLIDQASGALAEKGIVFYGGNIYTATDLISGDTAFVKSRPEAIKGFIRALIRAEDFMKKNPEMAMTLIAKYASIDEAGLRANLALFRFKVALDQSLLLTLEDESRWAMRQNPDEFKVMPNYIDYICSDAMSSAAPERLRLIR